MNYHTYTSTFAEAKIRTIPGKLFQYVCLYQENDFNKQYINSKLMGNLIVGLFNLEDLLIENKHRQRFLSLIQGVQTDDQLRILLIPEKTDINKMDMYHSYRSFYNTCRLLDLMASQTARQIKVIVLTTDLYGPDHISSALPYHSLVSGVIDTAVCEYENITAFHLDYPNLDETQILSAARFLNTYDFSYPCLFYRKNKFWTSKYISYIEKKTKSKLSQGVYLITGGFGAIGNMAANHLCSNIANSTIVLLGHANYNAHGVTLCNGNQVIIKEANIDNPHSLKEMICDITNQYGDIKGIVHTAGRHEFQYISHHSKESIERVFDPKVAGAYGISLLPELLSVDFIIFCSSLTSILPIAGQAAYCSANRFMNSMALYLRNQHKKNAVSICLDSIAHEGMCVKQARTIANRLGISNYGLFLEDIPQIPISDLPDIIDSAINGNHGLIVISKQELQYLQQNSFARTKSAVEQKYMNLYVTHKNLINSGKM